MNVTVRNMYLETLKYGSKLTVADRTDGHHIKIKISYPGWPPYYRHLTHTKGVRKKQRKGNHGTQRRAHIY